MIQRKGPKRGRKHGAKAPFLTKGVLTLLLAGTFWLCGEVLGSKVLGNNPVLASAGQALQSILWLPLAAGVLLVGIHFILNRVRPPKSSMDTREATETETETAEVYAPLKPAAARSTHHHKSAPSSPKDPSLQARWTPAVFSAIEWRRFEAVVETLFAQAGFETHSQSHGADGGVDIWLHSRHAVGPVSVVQCKHWQGKPVGVKEMREFFGVMSSHKLQRGTYATTSRFTSDALAFAMANGINAQDGDGLLKLIAQRTPDQQAQLLAVAYEGEYWKPTCASCGVKMTERASRNKGSRFWGCVNYPSCKRTMALKAG